MSRISKELRDRTKRYASAIIQLYVALPKRRPEVQVLGHQLLRFGTAVAAHFREACRARTTTEFVSKLDTCLQEADESDLWLELLRDDCGISTDAHAKVLAETNELMAIFVTIVKRSKDRL